MTFFISSTTSHDFLLPIIFERNKRKRDIAFKKAHSNNRFIVIIIQISVFCDVICHFKNIIEQ